MTEPTDSIPDPAGELGSELVVLFQGTPDGLREPRNTLASHGVEARFLPLSALGEKAASVPT